MDWFSKLSFWQVLAVISFILCKFSGFFTVGLLFVGAFYPEVWIYGKLSLLTTILSLVLVFVFIGVHSRTYKEQENTRTISIDELEEEAEILSIKEFGFGQLELKEKLKSGEIDSCSIKNHKLDQVMSLLLLCDKVR